MMNLWMLRANMAHHSRSSCTDSHRLFSFAGASLQSMAMVATKRSLAITAFRVSATCGSGGEVGAAIFGAMGSGFWLDPHIHDGHHRAFSSASTAAVVAASRRATLWTL